LHLVLEKAIILTITLTIALFSIYTTTSYINHRDLLSRTNKALTLHAIYAIHDVLSHGEGVLRLFLPCRLKLVPARHKVIYVAEDLQLLVELYTPFGVSLEKEVTLGPGVVVVLIRTQENTVLLEVER